MPQKENCLTGRSESVEYKIMIWNNQYIMQISKRYVKPTKFTHADEVLCGSQALYNKKSSCETQEK